MQKKSLLTRSQESAARQVPTANPTDMTLAITFTGSGGLEKLMGGGLPVETPYQSAGGSTPYMFFYYAIGDGAEAAKKALPTVHKGDLVLVANGEYEVLHSPVTMFICTGHQHWAERVPATQQLIKATREPQGRGSSQREEIEALVLVRAGDKLIPATWRTKAGACRGLVLALKELAAAATPEWLGQSEAHKLTAKLSMPWARFVADIDYGLETSRTNNEYVLTGAVCRPIDPNTFALLQNFLTNDDGMELLRETFAEHERKVTEVRAKLAS
jgi:hypothetical protein